MISLGFLGAGGEWTQESGNGAEIASRKPLNYLSFLG